VDKRYLKKIISYVLIAVISLIFTVNLGFHVVSDYNTEVDTAPAEIVSCYEVATLDAYIIRDEEYVFSENEGFGLGLYGDGEKVASGAEIVKLYEQLAGREETVYKLRELVHKKELVKRAELSTTTSYSVSALNERIENVYAQMLAASSSADAKLLSHLEDELFILLLQKDRATGVISNFNTILSENQKETDLLIASLGEALECVRTERPGYYYGLSACDGYEKLAEYRALSEMDYGAFDTLFNTEPEQIDSKCVGKLVYGNGWYIACPTELSLAMKLKAGRAYTVSFGAEGTASLQMKLERVVRNEEGKAFLVFSSDKVPVDFSFTRIQSVNIVYGEYTGFKLLPESLRMRNGVCGVYVLRGSVVEFRAVDPIYESDGFILAALEYEQELGYRSLGMYDNVIIRGKKLDVGNIID